MNTKAVRYLMKRNLLLMLAMLILLLLQKQLKHLQRLKLKLQKKH